MMNNRLKQLGIAIVIVAIGLSAMSLTGCDNGSDGTLNKTPEQITTAERWWKWVDSTSTATLDISVDNDGVCTVTVSGVVEPRNTWWKVKALYDYTVKANTSYTYKFEAWTKTGARDLNFQYYDGWEDDGPYLNENISITEERKTYTVEGEVVPKSGVRNLQFQCANQLGTFYVKIISITEVDVSVNNKAVSDFDDWLAKQYNNTADTPYNYKLNVSNLTGIKDILNRYPNKYVNLDLSGSTITRIPDHAFNIGVEPWTGCATLTGITIPNSVTSIGHGAFSWCESLTSIIIPNSVTSIGSGAFEGCTNLINVNIPNSVTSIDSGAFKFCINLNTVNIPNSVTRIGQGAFWGCDSLTRVTFQSTIPSSGFNSDVPFPGDLRDKYLSGGIGTYTRPNGYSSTWTKQ